MLRALRSQDWCAELMWSFPSHNSISLVLEMYERNIEEMIRDRSITGLDMKKLEMYQRNIDQILNFQEIIRNQEIIYKVPELTSEW
jgi:hypothetical protein